MTLAEIPVVEIKGWAAERREGCVTSCCPGEGVGSQGLRASFRPQASLGP